MRRAEFVIVGQGLAGTALAWALLRHGRGVLVLDREPPVTSSRVAAGLVTPVTGKRLAKSWRLNEFLPAAERFYRRVEGELGASFFHRRPTVRLFASADERGLFARRAAEFAGLVAPIDPPVDAHAVSNPHGGFEMPTAARLDVPVYLDRSREHFRQLGVYERADLSPPNIAVTDTGVTLPGVEAEYVVFCRGFDPAPHPLFADVPTRPAKGEVLTVRIPDLHEARTLNRRGFWVTPTDEPYVYRVGATYSWHELDCVPTPEGRAELEQQLRELIRVPFEVFDHRAAVRPIANKGRPLLGTHPAHPRAGYFNGLGSKGVLAAPFFAEQLASHLCDGTPIDPEVALGKIG